MKRAENLFPEVLDRENLDLAFHRAAAGKRDRQSVQRFGQDLECHLSEMRSRLLEGTFPVGKFKRFVVFDPKQRMIHTPAFPERVLHHALMNVCEPEFERVAVFDSYACRRGKGSLAAVRRAQWFASKHRWFLKMDVRRYFDTVDQRILLSLLARRFKDRHLLDWFARIIAGHSAAPGQGLPIGSLTSQYFANFYLGPLDRFVKETLACKAYVRYMDDFVVWKNDPEQLHQVLRRIAAFLTDCLELRLHDHSPINRTVRGMTFLGYRVFPEGIRLSRPSRSRFRRKMKLLEREFAQGGIDEGELQKRASSLLAFTDHAECQAWRLGIFHGEGPQRARTASIAAAAGTTTPAICVAPIATTTTRPTATTTSASASPQAHPTRPDGRRLNQGLPPTVPSGAANFPLPPGCK